MPDRKRSVSNARSVEEGNPRDYIPSFGQRRQKALEPSKTDVTRFPSSVETRKMYDRSNFFSAVISGFISVKTAKPDPSSRTLQISREEMDELDNLPIARKRITAERNRQKTACGCCVCLCCFACLMALTILLSLFFYFY